LQESNRFFVVNMPGVEQGNVSSGKFMEEVGDISAFTTVTVKISKTKTKRLTAGKKNRGEI